jgi:hypothetical protein
MQSTLTSIACLFVKWHACERAMSLHSTPLQSPMLPSVLQ